jgi:hypothetical protein
VELVAPVAELSVPEELAQRDRLLPHEH